MEAARLRPAASLPQRVQDVAERLSAHAKAELYEVLEGIAPSGELSTLLRLEPLVNDIVAQLNDSFKQAVTKRLLPEACKLLGGSRSAPPWPSGQPSPGLGTSLFGNPYQLQSHPVQHDNDILASSLSPGTGQPLRPDQGPPQDVASAAASSLLMGTLGPSGASSSSPMPTPLSTPVSGATSAGPAPHSHPHESRFAFANAATGGGRGADSRPSGSLHRSSVASGDDSVVPSDSLRFLGLGGDSAASALGLGLGLGLGLCGEAGAASANGDSFLPYGSDSGLGTPAAQSSPLSPGLAALSLGGGGGAVDVAAGCDQRRPTGPPASMSSSPSPHHPAGSVGAPYAALPLAIRPGSSLDPGLATPPVSLAGTEPLRAASAGGGGGAGGGVCLPSMHSQAAAGAASRHVGGGGELASSPPVPLFGGAPGPSVHGGLGGGGAHQPPPLPSPQQQQQYLMQRQAQAGQWQGEMGATAAAVNGSISNGYPPQQQPQQQHLQQYLQQQQQQQPAEQQQQQGAQGHYAATQMALQQQFQQAAGFPGGSPGGAPLSGRTPLAAAPEGPRASLDGRPHPGYGGVGPGVGVSVGAVALEMGYDSRPQQQQQQQLEQQQQPGQAALSERYLGGRGGLGGMESPPDYGMYGMVSPPAGGVALRGGSGGSGLGGPGQRGEAAFLLGPAAPGALLSPQQQAYAVSLPPAGSGNGGGVRGGGSPAMALPPGAGSPAPGTGMGLSPVLCGPAGEPLGRSSRSGAASAASAAESRSSSFSAGAVSGGVAATLGHGAQGGQHPGGARRGSGSGSGGAQTPPLAAVQPSPPASDASGPSSCASAAASASLPLMSGVGGGGAGRGSPAPAPGGMSMAAKLQQVAAKPVPAPGTPGRRAVGGPAGAPGLVGSPGGQGGAAGGGGLGGGGPKAPADMPGRFRCLPPAVQARVAALTRDNHVVLLKDFDEKVLSKMTLLVDKFGAGECLAMLDRIEEVLKGKAGRLANGPGYLDVSVSTRLDELKQRASGQVTAPEDYARSTLHSRIYAELRDLIARHGFLQWHHFDQGIINMLKKMPNATALERLNELAYHSFKNVDNPKSCIVSIFTTKPKYVNA